MKKWAFILPLVAVLGLWIVKAHALPDNSTPSEYTKTTVVKTTGGFVYMFNVTFIGVATGDNVQIYDGTSVAGTKRLTCAATSSNSACSVPLTVGAPFSNGIFLQVNSNTGSVYADLQTF